MKNLSIGSWADFPQEIERIREKYGLVQMDKYEQKNTILFRGQSDSTWKLKTTLERSSDKSWTVTAYSDLVYRCAPQIESFTEKSWNLPSEEDARRQILDSCDDFLANIPQSIYKFWIYLRHHGFPSPLLDWTRSPYIAAFFALAEKSNASSASVFVYIEHPEGVKGGWAGTPQVRTMGPYVVTDKRHFLQQCYYTIATRPAEKEHHFVCHEEIFERGSERQDVLIKIDIPRSERVTALRYLDELNINFFSLFHSEESLIRSVALKELEINA